MAVWALHVPNNCMLFRMRDSSYTFGVRPRIAHVSRLLKRSYSALAYMRHIGRPRRLQLPRTFVYRLKTACKAGNNLTQLYLQRPRQAIEDYCNLERFQALICNPCYPRSVKVEFRSLVGLQDNLTLSTDLRGSRTCLK